MFSLIVKLYKVMAANSNIFSQFTDGFKKGPKGIIKSVLLILLAIYLIGVMAGVYILSMINTYKVLAASGSTQYMPLISMLTALFVIMFFGFTTVAASYYSGNGEELLLTMPLTPAQFFAGKFCVAFVSDAIFGLAMFAISSIIYGYNEGLLTNPLFYIGFIVCAISFSVAAVFAIYFVLVVLLYFVPALRKRKLLSAISAVCIVVFAFGYSMVSTFVKDMMSNEQFAFSQVSGMVKTFTEIGTKASFLLYFSQALNGKIIPILILAAITAFIIFVGIPFTGKMYIKTLNGFSDIKTKKISATKAEEVIKNDVRSVSIFHAVFIRDIRNVLREPAFFTNGPLMVFLFPVIFAISFGVSFAARGQSLFEILQDLQLKAMEITSENMLTIKFYVTVILAAYTIFTGTFANLAATAFSREGKSLNNLKAMPIRSDIIIKAKFWHAMLYVGIADIISIIMLIVAANLFALPVAASEIIQMCIMFTIVSAVVSVLLIFIDMFIDTMNPKLVWDTPATATKQNWNVLLSMLLTIITSVFVSLLIVFVLPKKMVSFVILAAVMALIAAPVGAGYFKYAEKRISEM